MNNDRNEDNDYRRINRKREHEDRGGGKMVGRDKLTFSRHPLLVNNEPRLTFQHINYHSDHTLFSVLLVTTCKNVVILRLDRAIREEKEEAVKEVCHSLLVMYERITL